MFKKGVFLMILLASLFSLGHEGEKHKDEKHEDGVADELNGVSAEPSKEDLEKINVEYIKNVKPIFKKKCFDCHGSGNPLPWYSSIPGPKQLIEQDIEEAKEHMDMSADFPFSGHGSPQEDLEALAKSLKEGTMPPLRYKALHWNSSLDDAEKGKVEKWIVESLKVINSNF